ncbi:MAG: DUF1573 domain-containing protein [bacterium]
MKILCLAFLMSAFTMMAQPKLEVLGGSTHDWGKVLTSKGPLKTALKLKNAGNQPLKISEVKPGCGCTTAPLDKKYLKPGEIATVNVTLNPGSTSGELIKGLTISSNDPKVPVKAVTLKAFIIKPIQVLPQPYVAFPQTSIGNITESSMILKNTTEKPIKITQFIGSKGITILAKPKSIPPGGQISVLIRVIPNKKGYWNGTVTCKTDHPDLREMDVIVYGNAL